MERLNLDPPTAEKALESGRAFYRKGDLIQAKSSFKEASRLSPKDAVSLSNLSAVEFELGNYVGCSLFSQKALALLDAQENKQEAMQQKVYMRLAKAYIHSRKTDEAASILSKISPGEARGALERSVSAIQRLRKSFPDEKALRKLLLDRVSRYRPYLQDEAEYFSVGHDAAETIITPPMLSSSKKEIAGLFCGVGDARNLLVTLAFIGSVEASKPSLKKFHFTILDLKPAVFARDLLMFQLILDSIAESETKSSETITALSYMFGAQIMPRWTFDRIQQTISKVLAHLEMTERDVMGFFYIPTTARLQISRHLSTWRKTPEHWYTTATLRQLTLKQSSDRYLKEGRSTDKTANADGLIIPPGCEEDGPDSLGFDEFGALVPPWGILEKHEPRFFKIFMAWAKSRSSSAQQEIKQYIDTEWQPNVTLIDLDFETKREGPKRPLMDFRPHEVVKDLFGYLPLATVGHIMGVLNHFVGFFQFIARGLKSIQSKVVVEFVIGEMADSFEQLQHGLLRNPSVKIDKIDPSTFPTEYDAIHMSNIPDYIGGPLTTFLHGLPLLCPDNSSEMTSYVLRNTPVWMTHSDFLAEYLLLGKRTLIYDNFGTVLSDKSKATEDKLSGMDVDGGGVVMALPYSWKRGHSFPLPWAKLMSRQELKTWVHSHFLKLCLPYWRATTGNKLVLAPLNMTTTFHLITHLFKVGYPAHWLSEILAQLYEGEITTTARAPSVLIMDTQQTQRVYPSQKLCILPFLAEFTTLLSLWRPLLPFGLILPLETLPSISTIKEFKLMFRPRYPPPTDTERPHFVLVLKNTSFIVEDDLRTALLDVTNYKAETEDSIHVISTFRWETASSTATFWLDEGVMDNILDECDWKAYIWRSDTWRCALGPVDLYEEGAIVRGGSWI